MLRYVDFYADAATWPASRPAPRELTDLDGLLQVDVFQALLAVGEMTRLPGLAGLQLADFWAWLRYFSAVDAARTLCLRSEWDDLDPHQKTILSDDWGVGFTSSVVKDVLRRQLLLGYRVDIVDDLLVDDVLAGLWIETLEHLVDGKRGRRPLLRWNRWRRLYFGSGLN